MKTFLRALLPSALLLAAVSFASPAFAQGMFQGYPFATDTGTSRSSATLPMTGSECIPGDTRLSGGRAPQTSCYTQGDLKGNYLVTITDGATITPNFSGNAVVNQVTLGGNRTLAFPTGIVTGQQVMLLVTQDTTGTRTLSWPSSYQFVGTVSGYGTAPTLTTTPSRADLFQLTYTGNRIQVVGPASQGRLP